MTKAKKKAKKAPAKKLAVITGSKAAPPKDVRALTDRWADYEQLAKDIGTGLDAVYSMRSRNRIDAGHWKAVVASARKRRIAGVTLELLADMHAAKLKAA